ncbi:MAG: HlyC/CorC family transporter [bacterium]|nr:MAG: HlyC/CorC family transporter [bacterium]
MIVEIILYILFFTVLLIFSGFFSGAETAFFSLTPAQLKHYKNARGGNERRINKLMTFPRQLLITIVIGNTMVNITIASSAAVLTIKLSQYFGLNQQVIILLDVLVVTFVILILSEILPKIVAVRNSENFARGAVYPLTFIFYLLYPVSYGLARFTHFLQTHSGLSEKRILLTEDELKTLAEVGEEHGTLLKDEKEMIHSIFEFGQTTVKEVMVPRTDMVMVDTAITLSKLMQLVKTKLHSRIPVYKEEIDNIIGILYVKDLLPFVNKVKKEQIDLQKLVRTAYFVPEQKKIDELLREFQEEHIHMALVVDEYGGISGLITLEDIIEEIVGEIQDEYDKESPLFKKVDDKTFIIDGKMSIEEINAELDLAVPAVEGVETISGFILNLLGSLPKEKEEVKYQNLKFIVEKINRNRILKVRLEKLPPSENEKFPQNQAE